MTVALGMWIWWLLFEFFISGGFDVPDLIVLILSGYFIIDLIVELFDGP